jgi:hypothetical protein
MWALSAIFLGAAIFWFARLDVWGLSYANCRTLAPWEVVQGLSLPVSLFSGLGAFVSAVVALVRYPERRRWTLLMVCVLPILLLLFPMEVPNQIQLRARMLVGPNMLEERKKCLDRRTQDLLKQAALGLDGHGASSDGGH